MIKIIFETWNMKVVFSNDNFLVLDKPAGVLVHKTAAGETDTLVDWFLSKFPNLPNLNWSDPTRPGIVHRLDKDTSGLIVLAKNPETMLRLQELFKSGQVKKTYQALVLGKMPAEGKIEAAIVRDSQNNQMKAQETAYSFTKGTVRPAVTEYRALKYYRYHDQDLTLVEAMPQTGRMHQIRVHLKYAGFPIIGDQMYFNKASKKISNDLNLSRQFLHAIKLEFNGQVFESDLADDLKDILNKLG